MLMPPTPITVIRIDVMNAVVADRGLFAGAKGIYASHIAEHAPANMVNVIEVNLVSLCLTGVITPTPPDRNTRIVEVANVVMRHLIVPALADPYSDCAHENTAARLDNVVVHGAKPSVLLGFGAVARGPFANPDSAGAKIVQMAANHAALPAGVPEPDAISADMSNLAIFYSNLARVIGHDYCGNTEGGLAVTLSFRRQNILRVLKLQAAQREVLHGAIGAAFEANEIFDHRRHHLCLGHIFARQRDVRQCAVAVEKPFTRSIEGFSEVLQVVGRWPPPLKERPGRSVTGDQRARLFVSARHSMPGNLPRMINHRGDVTQPVRGHLKNGGEVLRAACDRPAAEVRFLAGEGVNSPPHLPRHIIIELVGYARAGGSLAVYPQLLEIPPPGLYFRHRGGPNTVG